MSVLPPPPEDLLAQREAAACLAELGDVELSAGALAPVVDAVAVAVLQAADLDSGCPRIHSLVRDT